MSVPLVPELLRCGAQAPAWVSAADAVMGEDWAYLQLGRGGAERRLTYGEARRTGARRAAIGGALSPNPQALVKLIGSGGTATARGLQAQMNYLSRQGDVPLVSSESTFGTELGAGDAAGIAAAWGLPDSDARAVAIKADADREVARLAKSFGLQPEATLARFAAETVSIGLGRDYRAEEFAERAADRAARGQQAERVDEVTAQLADFHRRAGTIYREAVERVREIECEDPRGAPDLASTRNAAGGRGQARSGERRAAPSASRGSGSWPGGSRRCAGRSGASPDRRGRGRLI